MTASMSASYHILRTPAEPAPAPIATIAMEAMSGSTWPDTMINATNAVKTASSITRGFMSATNSGRRAVKRDHAGTGGRQTIIAVVFMTESFLVTH